MKKYPTNWVFFHGGPRENRTPASAMRMPRNATLLWAPIYRLQILDLRFNMKELLSILSY